MTAARRLDQVEAALSPTQLVLRWPDEAQAYPTSIDYVRSFVDLPDAAAPLSQLGRDAEQAVRSSMKGQPQDEVERAVQRAVGDVVFLFCLVRRINQATADATRHYGLAAPLLNVVVAALLCVPTDRRDELETEIWVLWFTVIRALLTAVDREVGAWQQVERDYLGGRDALFADLASAWAETEQELDRLEDMYRRLAPPADFVAAMRAESGEPPADPEAVRLEDARATATRADLLADDARVAAYRVLGQRERGVQIMARRLR